MTNAFWNSTKKLPTYHQLVEAKIEELNSQTAKISDRNCISRFFSASKSSSSLMPSQVSHQVQLLLPSQIPPDPITDVTTEIIPKENQRNTPKQVEIKGQLQHCLTELDRLRKIRQFGLSTDETFAKIEKYETEKSKLNKSLKRLVNNAVHSRESRKKKKAKLEKVMQLIPSSNLVKEKPGPWPLESNQPDLLRTIADIVISQSAADDKTKLLQSRSCTR